MLCALNVGYAVIFSDTFEKYFLKSKPTLGVKNKRSQAILACHVSKSCVLIFI